MRQPFGASRASGKPLEHDRCLTTITHTVRLVAPSDKRTRSPTTERIHWVRDCIETRKVVESPPG
jgi:hypothetical protein